MSNPTKYNNLAISQGDIEVKPLWVYRLEPHFSQTKIRLKRIIRSNLGVQPHPTWPLDTILLTLIVEKGHGSSTCYIQMAKEVDRIKSTPKYTHTIGLRKKPTSSLNVTINIKPL